MEKLKNINEFNDDILHHKEADIEELASRCEGGSASRGSGDRAGFTSVPGSESASLGINASAPRGESNLRTRLTSFVGRVNCSHNPN